MTLIGNIVLASFLVWYVVLGLYTDQRLLESAPLPANLMSDFSFYQQAYERAIEGGNAYELLGIGQGFFYPPPALLIVGLFARIMPIYLRNAVYIGINLALSALIVWGIGRRYGYGFNRIWWWFPLVFAYAPIFEALNVGQINLIAEFGIFLLYVLEASVPILSGLGLALAASAKLVPVVFCVYFVAGRQMKPLFWSIVWSVVAFAATILVFGWQTILYYPDAFHWIVNWFTPGPNANSQALVTMVNGFGWIKASQWQQFQLTLELYLALMFAISGLLAFRSRIREPFFIVLCVGSMVAPNVLWYHHYVFVVVPFLIWIAWSRFNPIVIAWCLIGLTLVQIDRFYWTQGLLVHLVAHLSIVAMVMWQIVSLLQMRWSGSAKRRNESHSLA